MGCIFGEAGEALGYWSGITGRLVRNETSDPMLQNKNTLPMEGPVNVWPDR